MAFKNVAMSCKKLGAFCCLKRTPDTPHGVSFQDLMKEQGTQWCKIGVARFADVNQMISVDKLKNLQADIDRSMNCPFTKWILLQETDKEAAKKESAAAKKAADEATKKAEEQWT